MTKANLRARNRQCDFRTGTGNSEIDVIPKNTKLRSSSEWKNWPNYSRKSLTVRHVLDIDLMSLGSVQITVKVDGEGTGNTLGIFLELGVSETFLSPGSTALNVGIRYKRNREGNVLQGEAKPRHREMPNQRRSNAQNCSLRLPMQIVLIAVVRPLRSMNLRIETFKREKKIQIVWTTYLIASQSIAAIVPRRG